MAVLLNTTLIFTEVRFQSNSSSASPVADHRQASVVYAQRCVPVYVLSQTPPRCRSYLVTTARSDACMKVKQTSVHAAVTEVILRCSMVITSSSIFARHCCDAGHTLPAGGQVSTSRLSQSQASGHLCCRAGQILGGPPGGPSGLPRASAGSLPGACPGWPFRGPGSL